MFINSENVAYLGGKPFKNYGSTQDPWFVAKDLMEQCGLDIAMLDELLEYVESSNKKQVEARSITSQEKAQVWIVNFDGAIEMIVHIDTPASKRMLDAISMS